jgi:hypothetical protein
MLFEKMPIADEQTPPCGMRLHADPADRDIVRGTPHLIDAIFVEDSASASRTCTMLTVIPSSKEPIDA